MSYFLFSFLVGGTLTFIPSIRTFLDSFQMIFYNKTLSSLNAFVLWGIVQSIVLFTAKSFLMEGTAWQLWKFALFLALFLTVFFLFVSVY